MNRIQNPYLIMVNLIYLGTRWMSEKVKEVLMMAAVITIAAWYPFFYTAFFTKLPLSQPFITPIIPCVALIVLLLASVKQMNKKVEWNRTVVIFYYAFTIFLLITAIIHPLREGYVLFGFFLLLYWPAFYIVWNNRQDYRTLFQKIALVFTIMGLIVFIISVISMCYKPYDTITQFLTTTDFWYQGMTDNSNKLSRLYLSVLISAIYLFLSSDQSLLRLLATISAGIAVGLEYITNSDTGRIIVLLLLVCFVWMMVTKKFQQVKREPRVTFLLFVLMYAGIIILGITILLQNSILDFQDLATQGRLDSDSGTCLAAALIPVNSALYQKLDLISSGRWTYWRLALEHLNLFGNNPNQVILYSGTKSISALHNAVVEFTFLSGWPAGLLYLGLEFVTGIFVLRRLFGRRQVTIETWFVMMILIVYIMESLTETQTIFVAKDNTLFFYFALMYVFDKKQAIPSSKG